MSQYTKLGDFVKDNKIIFKYVYDNFGFRVGVVVAEKGEGKWHPKIGWALFKEVPYTTIVHTEHSQIPAYKDLDIFPFIPVEETVISKENKLELFKKALNRTNFNSFEYYVDLYGSDVHRDTTFRNTSLEILYKDGNSKEIEYISGIDDYYGIVKSMKSAIKSLEFRAYRYFNK